MTFVALLALSLAGCGRSDTAPSEPATNQEAVPAALASEPLPSAEPLHTAASSNPATSAAPSESRDPHVVAQAWADTVRARDWAAAYSYWGDHGARSGKTLAQFAAEWSPLKKPLVLLGKGSQEGAAGSSYYTVPVTISDGDHRISGELVLRRVNDVDGATAEQLRWHIESTTLHP